jgi:class 3 adenylate cyclase/tetratricopeptide (TPR) repeat protein
LDVAAWLRELGLERYAQAFLDNDVAPTVLPELTEQDLKDLGVSLGHRRLLLKAIRELRDGPVEPRSTADAKPTSAPSEPATRPEAERRQLTVLFCDLVGSTELSGTIDPEAMRDVITQYQNAVAGETLRFDGHVAKFMGDGVLAYFGWPRAHEDDAERAVRAGLALARAVAGLEASGRPLAARIGVATGLVVVGDLIGEGAAQEEAVVGETPNLAARLQTLAGPGSVVISQSTRRLVGGLFELSDLGPTRLKGFAEPLAAFRVAGESHAEGRFEALRGEHLTALVGREHELAMLLERWAWAKDGDGQVVLIAGEPGIGKSRLLRALREALAGEPHVALSHFCSPYHTNSALHPVIAQLERAAGFAADDAAADKLAKLEALPLVAALVGVGSDSRYPTLNLSPPRQKQRTLEVLIAQLAGLARDRPVLELYEDLHWADPSTLELLDLLVERVRALPVLVVLTCRPEFSPPWRGQDHVTALTMNRLGRRQGATLVERVTDGKPLPAEVLDQILARTDGVPLFVEELTKTVLESGLLRGAGDHYELAGPLASFAIPTTLRDSLMARLDRLGPVKEIAQIGAAIGREFPYALLAAVADRAHDALGAALDRLVSSELIFRRGTAPDAIYSFKHVLVQDAAYQSLLKRRRQELHARIGNVLEELFPDTRDQVPEVLAHHHSEAGLVESAMDLWLVAGRSAIKRSAFKEAVEHLSKGLALLAQAKSGTDELERELQLRTTLGPALIAVRGFAAAEVGQTYARARELCAMLGEQPQQFPALWGSWVFHTVRAQLPEANDIGYELLRLAQSTGDEELTLQAHHALETSLFWCGRLPNALEHMQLGLAIYDPDRHRSHAASFGGHDPGVCCLAFKALALWLSGYADQAKSASEQAVSLARQLRQPASLGHAQQLSCRLQVLQRDVTALLANLEDLVDLAHRHGFPHPLAVARMAHGWALGIEQDVEAGIASFEEGVRIYEGSGAALARSMQLAMLAEVLGRADVLWKPCSWSRRLSSTSGRAMRGFMKPNSCASKASCSFRIAAEREAKPRPVCVRRSRSPASRRQGRGSCGPRPAWPGCGATRAGAPRRTNCSRLCTTGSPKDSRPPI